MVLPSQWKNEYGTYFQSEMLAGFDADLVTAPVLMNGSVPLYVYRLFAKRLLRNRRPGIVYSHNEPYALSTFQWCQASASNGHIPFGFFSCQNLVKRYPLPFRWGESWVYRNSSFAFPITQSVDEVHRQKGYRGPATILPLGFDPKLYFPANDIAQRHMTASGPFRLAFVGRVVEEKGLLTLVKALVQVTDLEWRLIVVGYGPHEPAIKAELAKCGIADRVEWRGFLPHDHVAAFYESVDALVLPSESRPNWKEQFGRVLVEALACGTPVVGSDSGEIPNIIRTSGGGLVFKEADVESCAVALRQLMANVPARANMAVRGNAYVNEHYALPKLADRFADQIEAVAWSR